MQITDWWNTQVYFTSTNFTLSAQWCVVWTKAVEGEKRVKGGLKKETEEEWQKNS